MADAVDSQGDSDVSTSHISEEYPSKTKLVLIMLCLISGTFLVAVDTTIISVAIPRISTQFKATNDVGWYGSGYLMTLTAFQPSMSNIYKMFDPKAAYIVSIIVFEVGSTVCASAATSYAFIIGRVIAGLGAAGLLQGALGSITYIAPLEKRQLYIGAVVSVFGLSACTGPIIGGALSDRLSWRWCFWINLPCGAATLVLVFFSFKIRTTGNTTRNLKFRHKLKSLDPIGILLLLGAVCCLLMVLQEGGTSWPWKSGRTIGLLSVSVVLLIMFGFVQSALGNRATVPVRILRDRTVLAGSMFLAISNASSYVKLYYLPFYFQAVQSSSAIKSGVDFLSLAVPQMIASILSSLLVTYTGHYIPFILLGQLISAIGTGLLTTINLTTSTALWATFMALAGFGTGMGENSPYIAIQAVMESEEDIFFGNGVATFVALLGGSLAISIGSTILTNSLDHFVPLFASPVLASTVLRAGALNLNYLTSSPSVLTGLKRAYNRAINNVMIFALIITCISVATASAVQLKHENMYND